MLIQGLKRAAAWVFSLLTGAWAFVLGALDWFGRATSARDAMNVAGLPEFLFLPPWWIPGLACFALTAFLIWLTWPRSQIINPVTDKQTERVQFSAPPVHDDSINKITYSMFRAKVTDKSKTEIFEQQNIHSWKYIARQIREERWPLEDNVIDTGFELLINFEKEISYNYTSVCCKNKNALCFVISYNERSALVFFSAPAINNEVEIIFSEKRII